MKLSERIHEALMALEACNAPWNAQHRTNKIMLGKLHLMGLASWVDGGWVITDVGRAALQQEPRG